MEAASVPATRPSAPGQAVRDFVSKYGLIVVLLAMPVYYGIKDLTSDEADLSRLGNNLIDGLSNGAIWALVAIGYTLVYGIIELINFAHGEVFMIGSFVSVSIWQTLGVTPGNSLIAIVGSILIGIVLAMLCSGTLNVMIERVAYKPLRNAPKLAPLITAIGMSFILQNVGLLWRGQPDSSPDLIGSQK